MDRRPVRGQSDVCFLRAGGPARCRRRSITRREINLRADKLSTGNGSNQIEASGNVEIKREATTLKADEVRFNRATQEVEAKGRVRIDDPEWKIKSADSLKLNMGQETGEIENGDLFLEQGHISISGRRFEKFGGQSYHVDDGFFTTCLCESGAPSWKFSAEQMDLALDGVGTIKNGYFYVLDVPVFYLPYGYFPLNTERQTGFSFPEIRAFVQRWVSIFPAVLLGDLEELRRNRRIRYRDAGALRFHRRVSDHFRSGF